MPAPATKLTRDEHCVFTNARGAVMVEFLIAFMPVFLLFLGVVQLALLSAARMVVQHAAVTAARSASVVLDDDPARYDGEPRMQLRSGVRDVDADRRAAALSTALTGGGSAVSSLTASSKADGPRMAAIRLAAYTKLAAVAPSHAARRLLMPDRSLRNVESAIGDAGLGRWLQAAMFVPTAAAVTLPKQPGSTELWRDRIEPDELVTVRVTYLAPCIVPVVSQLMCRTLGFDLLKRELTAAGGDERAAAALRELRNAPLALGQLMFFVQRIPVKILQAEASLPLQRAPYCYASQLDDEGRCS